MSWKDKLEVIIEGWGNAIWKNEEVEKIARERAEICAKCDSNTGWSCKECGCPLFAKTRSMKPDNKCDLGKWEEKDKE
jgi:hypothetical protein